MRKAVEPVLHPGPALGYFLPEHLHTGSQFAKRLAGLRAGGIQRRNLGNRGPGALGDVVELLIVFGDLGDAGSKGPAGRHRNPAQLYRTLAQPLHAEPDAPRALGKFAHRLVAGRPELLPSRWIAWPAPPPHFADP